jgi:hypothetical protein
MNESLPKYQPLTTSDSDFPDRQREDDVRQEALPAVTFNASAEPMDIERGEPRFANTAPNIERSDALQMTGDTMQEADTAGTSERQAGPLFVEGELNGFKARWDEVQTSFVDEPRQAVKQADSLVASVVNRIAEQFSKEREQLESQWESGNDVSTEDLRQALKRYRAFFGRLLAV